jgi:hypothetical protein
MGPLGIAVPQKHNHSLSPSQKNGEKLRICVCTRQDRWIQTELVFTLAKNASKPNPFKIISLQTTRKENNWKTEETLARTVTTLETERIKRSNPWYLWWCAYARSKAKYYETPIIITRTFAKISWAKNFLCKKISMFDEELILSNPIFLSTAYSPALIFLGVKEVGGLLVIILQF